LVQKNKNINYSDFRRHYISIRGRPFVFKWINLSNTPFQKELRSDKLDGIYVIVENDKKGKVMEI
jgi:hypothetical protein